MNGSRETRGEGAPGAFSVPARYNPGLQAVVERINADEELRQLWRCANVNAVDRLNAGDHGEVHVRIVANAALRLLRLLRDVGQTPGVVLQHRLTPEDAELIVVLAAALHDLGVSIHRDHGEEFSLGLANLKAKELLAGLYPLRERTIIVSEMLHAVAALSYGTRCLTLEAGVLKLANALDMTEGRSRLPAEAGAVAAIDEVKILKGDQRPVRVDVRMSHAAGLAPLDEALRRALERSTLAGSIEAVARIENDAEKRLVWLDTLEPI